MCELYPAFHSCCGVPVRIALIFIAVLSIVTGALLNAGLKKAGVNIASIDDVKNIKKEDFAMKKQNSTLPPIRRPRPKPKSPEASTNKHRRRTTTKASLRALSEDETDNRNVIVVTPKRTTVGNTPRIRTINRARGESPSTVEIVGEDTTTESSRAEMKTKLLLRDSDEDSDEESSEEENSEKQQQQQQQQQSSDKQASNKQSSDKQASDKQASDKQASDKQASDKQASDKQSSDKNVSDKQSSSDQNSSDEPATTKKPPMDTSIIMRKVSTVNRNGINLLSCAYVALGILLLVANFTNSAELALLYVTLSVVNTIASLCLLIGTVSECAKNQQHCLLSKMDWFSGFMLTLVWFLSIFIWLFFAAVANGLANGLTR